MSKQVAIIAAAVIIAVAFVAGVYIARRPVQATLTAPPVTAEQQARADEQFRAARAESLKSVGKAVEVGLTRAEIVETVGEETVAEYEKKNGPIPDPQPSADTANSPRR